MFPAKSFADNPSQSDHHNQGHICRDCEESIRKVFKDVNRQVFLDDRLTADQKMVRLNNPKSIERGLVDFIANQIETAVRSHYHLHRTCIGSIDEQFRRFIPVGHDSRIISRHGIQYVDDGDAGAILMVVTGMMMTKVSSTMNMMRMMMTMMISLTIWKICCWTKWKWRSFVIWVMIWTIIFHLVDFFLFLFVFFICTVM